MEFESAHPRAFLATVLELSQLRNAFVVGRALAERFPTEASWIEFVDSPALQEAVEEVAQIVEDMRLAYTVLEGGPEDVVRAVEQHWARALDAVIDLSAMIGVDGAVLLAVLASTGGRVGGEEGAGDV